MRVRELRASDVPELERMYRAAGFDYEFPNFANGMFEAAAVVVDDEDRPVMAAAAERLVQLYLFAGSGFEHPASKLAAIRLLHHTLADALRAKGYRDANAFLPPAIDKSFGRRLMRTFGWVRNWTSYAIRF